MQLLIIYHMPKFKHQKGFVVSTLLYILYMYTHSWFLVRRWQESEGFQRTVHQHSLKWDQGCPGVHAHLTHLISFSVQMTHLPLLPMTCFLLLCSSLPLKYPNSLSSGWCEKERETRKESWVRNVTEEKNSFFKTRVFFPPKGNKKAQVRNHYSWHWRSLSDSYTIQSSYWLSHLLARVISQQAHRCSTNAGDGWIARRPVGGKKRK